MHNLAFYNRVLLAEVLYLLFYFFKMELRTGIEPVFMVYKTIVFTVILTKHIDIAEQKNNNTETFK